MKKGSVMGLPKTKNIGTQRRERETQAPMISVQGLNIQNFVERD